LLSHCRVYITRFRRLNISSIRCMPNTTGNGLFLIPSLSLGPKTALICQLRYYLHEVCVAAGITTTSFRTQLRHTYASEMIRSGVTLCRVLGQSSGCRFPAYLDKRRKDVQIYRQALADEDFETLRTLGHKMKGTGVGMRNFIDSLLGPTTAAPAVPLAGPATRRSLRLTRL
jgi:hypothetical protein